LRLKHVPYNNLAKLEAALGDNTAAVLLEVVQGEGGVRVGDKAYFQKVRELCDAQGVLLIIDEVQTGFGRTGWPAEFPWAPYCAMIRSTFPSKATRPLSAAAPQPAPRPWPQWM
jgi:hypothetical protein